MIEASGSPGTFCQFPDFQSVSRLNSLHVLPIINAGKFRQANDNDSDTKCTSEKESLIDIYFRKWTKFIGGHNRTGTFG